MYLSLPEVAEAELMMLDIMIHNKMVLVVVIKVIKVDGVELIHNITQLVDHKLLEETIMQNLLPNLLVNLDKVEVMYQKHVVVDLNTVEAKVEAEAGTVVAVHLVLTQVPVEDQDILVIIY